MSITFVLVNPARAANVGAAARAMKTMGFTDLVLVESDLQRHEEAHWVAHGAQDILEQASTNDSLATVKSGVDLMIGTTARERGDARHYLSPSQVSAQLSQQHGRVALVFGCEASGLSNEQLALCDIYSYIPLASPYPSLNLGQAVMVYAYALSGLHHHLGLTNQHAEAGDLQHLKQRIEQLLATRLDHKHKKLNDWLLEHVSGLSDRDVRMSHQLINLLLERSPK